MGLAGSEMGLGCPAPAALYRQEDYRRRHGSEYPESGEHHTSVLFPQPWGPGQDQSAGRQIALRKVPAPKLSRIHSERVRCAQPRWYVLGILAIQDAQDQFPRLRTNVLETVAVTPHDSATAHRVQGLVHWGAGGVSHFFCDIGWSKFAARAVPEDGEDDHDGVRGQLANFRQKILACQSDEIARIQCPPGFELAARDFRPAQIERSRTGDHHQVASGGLKAQSKFQRLCHVELGEGAGHIGRAVNRRQRSRRHTTKDNRHSWGQGVAVVESQAQSIGPDRNHDIQLGLSVRFGQIPYGPLFMRGGWKPRQIERFLERADG